MRLVFFVLLLLNLGLLAYTLGYLGAQETGREPERLTRQLEPEKLRILPAATAADLAAAIPVPDPAPAASEASACQRIEGLAAAEAETIKQSLTATPGWDVSVLPLTPTQAPDHWVLIPELPTRAAAEKKKSELRQLGITEGQIVENTSIGPFVVSLGIFRNQEGAEEFFQAAVRKGVRSARLIKREHPANRFATELRAPTAALALKLADLLPTLPHAHLANCSSQ